MFAPFDLVGSLGKLGAYAIYLLIGVAFGAILEQSGFGRSTKLAAQFYFKDQTVLKVMFTAIVVAMVLVFGAYGLGWLDFEQVFVDETYLWPGILGGLIMGVGFIIGGFCPGTSLVSAATLKVDAWAFVAGLFVGIFAFGETVPSFEQFWHSSYMGRYLLSDWLGLPIGVVVFLVVLLALLFFWGAERLEALAGGDYPSRAPRARLVGAAVLPLLALGVMALGTPGWQERWEAVAAEQQPRLESGEVAVSPLELAHLLHDDHLRLLVADLRPEADYNLFHLKYAEHVGPELDELARRAADWKKLKKTAIVLVDGDGGRSAEGWKVLTALDVPNVFLLDGGMQAWLERFHEGLDCEESGEGLHCHFAAALGERYEAAFPDVHHLEEEYEKKVKLSESKGPKAGGCG